MKFVVSSSLLFKNLLHIDNVVISNPVLPILENVLFNLQNDKLTILGTDLETSVKVTFPVVSEEGISFCLPSKILKDGLKSLSEQPLTIEINKETLSVKVVHQSGYFSVQGESDENYPKEHTKQDTIEISLPSNALLDGINSTSFVTVVDEMRPVLGGVLFEFRKDQIRFVATDGHRLIRFIHKALGASEEVSCIVPKKSLNLLKSLLKDEASAVTLKLSALQGSYTHLFVEMKHIEIVNEQEIIQENEVICRLVDGKFPQYGTILPESNPFSVKVNKAEISQVIKRSLVFAKKEDSRVKCTLKKGEAEILLSTEDKDYGYNSNDRIACDYNGESLDISFNGKYLQEMFQVIYGERIDIQISAPDKGVLFRPETNPENEELLMFLMPLRLPN